MIIDLLLIAFGLVVFASMIALPILKINEMYPDPSGIADISKMAVSAMERGEFHQSDLVRKYGKGASYNAKTGMVKHDI